LGAKEKNVKNSPIFVVEQADQTVQNGIELFSLFAIALK